MEDVAQYLREQEKKDFLILSALYQKLSPQTTLIPEPLPDQTTSVPLPDVCLFGEDPFLEKLCGAITQHFCKAELLNTADFEQKNLWSTLLSKPIRLFVIPEEVWKSSPHLSALTKEFPGRILKMVERIPLLTIQSTDTPENKKAIWAILKRFFEK